MEKIIKNYDEALAVDMFFERFDVCYNVSLTFEEVKYKVEDDGRIFTLYIKDGGKWCRVDEVVYDI